jgi:D-alanyl-D-alanine carboxypeptidase
VIAALAGFAPAASQARLTPGEALNRSLDRIVALPGAPPALSVLTQSPGRRQFRRRGVADLRTGRRPTARDRMRIASMAKAFSGAVALALVARGQLGLDETIGQRLPGVLPKANDVTLAQALQHTGGLPDYIRQPAFVRQFTRHPRAYLSPSRILSFVRDRPLHFRPGSRYEYSDTDNIVVARMAEAATGRSYDQLLAAYVYRPLGLRGTSLPRTPRLPRPFLHGYALEPGRAPQDVSEAINPSGAWASGGIVSTPDDVGRFFRGYVGGRVFAGVPQSFVPGSSQPPGPGVNAAGLGLFRYRTRCGTVYGHTGSFPGYRMFAAASADGRRSVVFSVDAQVVPGSGSVAVSNAIRRAQESAVCLVLRS